MTPAEADERIILSRHTLSRYVAMTAAGEAPVADLGMITAEIGILEAIAEEHPGKASKLAALVMEWVRLREGLVGKLH